MGPLPDAGIVPSMVMRYYGNEEGLFAAAVSVDLRLPEVGVRYQSRSPGGAPGPRAGARPGRLCATQLLGPALTRYVLRFPPAVGLSREEIVAWPAPTVQRYPMAPSP